MAKNNYTSQYDKCAKCPYRQNACSYKVRCNQLDRQRQYENYSNTDKTELSDLIIALKEKLGAI